MNEKQLGSVTILSETGYKSVSISMKVKLGDVTLYVHDNGYVEGSDGKQYYSVSEEDTVNGGFKQKGWSADISTHCAVVGGELQEVEFD